MWCTLTKKRRYRPLQMPRLSWEPFRLARSFRPRSGCVGFRPYLPGWIDCSRSLSFGKGTSPLRTGVVHGTQVAELAWAFTLALFKQIPAFSRSQSAREWERETHRPKDLCGSTVGIVGFGGIGRQFAKRALAFEMRVLAVDVQPSSKPENIEALWGINRLDDLLKEADVVFLACPHTPETDKLIDARALRLMKKSAFLVNTARGGIVDEAALVAALREREISGAGLDVFEEEPLPESSPLWEMENVMLTPHVAGGSVHRPGRVIDLFCENLSRYLAGSSLLNEVDRKLGYPRTDQRVGY